MSKNLESIKNKILISIIKYKFYFCFILCSGYAFAQSTNQTDKDLLNVFDNVDKTFRVTASSWVDMGEHYAKSIFFALALMNITIVGIRYVLYKNEIQELFNSLVITLLTLCGFLTIIQFAPTLIDTFFLKTFEMLGSKVTAVHALSPTGIVDKGIDLVGIILNHTPSTSLLQVFNSLTVVISCLVIFGCFFYLGADLLITKIHAYIIMYGCITFLGFSGLDKFRFIAISQLKSCLNVSVKIFLLYLIIATGIKSTDEIIAIISSNTAYSPSISGLLFTTSVCLIFVTLVKRVPMMANEFLTGAMSASAADKIGAFRSTVGTAAKISTGGVAQKAGQVVGGAVSKGVAGASAAAQTFRNGASKGDNPASKVANGLGNVAKNAAGNMSQKASDASQKLKDNIREKKENSIFNDRNPPKPPKYF